MAKCTHFRHRCVFLCPWNVRSFATPCLEVMSLCLLRGYVFCVRMSSDRYVHLCPKPAVHACSMFHGYLACLFSCVLRNSYQAHIPVRRQDDTRV